MAVGERQTHVGGQNHGPVDAVDGGGDAGRNRRRPGGSAGRETGMASEVVDGEEPESATSSRRGEAVGVLGLLRRGSGVAAHGDLAEERRMVSGGGSAGRPSSGGGE